MGPITTFRRQARRYGGDGVAEVTEFAAVELGARIGHQTPVRLELDRYAG